jgi:hypothetical protein
MKKSIHYDYFRYDALCEKMLSIATPFEILNLKFQIDWWLHYFEYMEMSLEFYEGRFVMCPQFQSSPLLLFNCKPCTKCKWWLSVVNLLSMEV